MELHLQWKREWNVPTAVGVLSLGVGTAVGYFLGTRRGKVVEEISYDKEDDQMSFKFYEGTTDEDEKIVEAIKVVSEEFEQVIEKINPDDIPEDEPEEEEEPLPDPEDIFPSVTPGWDYDEEVPKRTTDAPYIIHRDEFFGEESGYTQSTLMYYKGDDILVDEQDVPIYDKSKIVCELEFGKGSEDPSIVYVRNDKLEAEYEVILDRGLFQVEVLGAQLEHSFDKKTPLLKFRE